MLKADWISVHVVIVIDVGLQSMHVIHLALHLVDFLSLPGQSPSQKVSVRFLLSLFGENEGSPWLQAFCADLFSDVLGVAERVSGRN